MSAHFVENPGFEEAFKRSTVAGRALNRIVEEVADDYRATVPVDTGKLRESIYSTVQETGDGLVGQVGATDPLAGLVEFGTALTKPDGSLRNAVDRAGFKGSKIEGLG